MKKISSKILFFLIFFLPFFLFLRSKNLIQIQSYDVLNILIFQLLLITILFIFYYLIKFLIKKKSIFNYNNLLISFSLVYFLSFFFEDLKLKKILENIFFSGFLFSVIIYILILTVIFFFSLLVLNNKNHKKKFLNFLTIFVILNYSYVFFNFIEFLSKKESYYLKSPIIPTNFKQNKQNIDIYFIILDSMTSLEHAEKIGAIENKDSIIEKFETFGGKYISNSFTNYPTTYLSIQSILNLDYPVTEKSKKYSTYKNFFPNTIINNYSLLPITKLNKQVNRNFYWSGNKYQNCKSNTYEPKMCGDEKRIVNFLNSLELFYQSSIFDFFVRRVSSIKLNKYSQKSTFEILKDEDLAYFKKIDFSEKNFFFMHLLKPHRPFNVNKNCKESNHSDYNIGYSENYKCVLFLIENFVKNINKISKKEKIIIFVGDHGYIKNKKKMSNIDKLDRLKIFNLIFSPPKCNNEIEFAKSPVNISRFVFNCSENTKLKYLPNNHYFTYYESHKKWGEIELINVNK